MSIKQQLVTSLPALALTLLLLLDQVLTLYDLALLVGVFVCSQWIMSSTRISVGNRRIIGRDINKKGTAGGQIDIPESQGLAPACSHLICVLLMIWLNSKEILDKDRYYSAIFITIFNFFIGFYDDVLQIRWRYKAFLSMLCALPAICHYNGAFEINIPYLQHSLYLGPLMLVYLACMSTFVPNSINIYAGINGLQAGQSIIICISVLLHAYLQIKDNSDIQSNTEAIKFMMPAVWGLLSLFRWNAYPSKVFVGDTLCFWIGGVIVSAAYLNNSIVLLLFLMLPQVFNFLYSIPQLFGFVHCPRHRLAEYLQDKNKLKGRPTNLNLLNLFLITVGPTSEEMTCFWLLLMQLIINGAVIYIHRKINE